MIAAEGREAALEAALVRLAGRVSALEGCEGVEMMRDARAPAEFIFIERWPSVEAHKAAGKALGAEALAEVMASVAEPPKGRYLDFVPL
jgi:quinol monooxygenase YgiN